MTTRRLAERYFLDLNMVREIGPEVARTKHPDIVDLQVAMEARARGFAVVTSDPRDIRKIDSSIRIVVVSGHQA